MDKAQLISVQFDSVPGGRVMATSNDLPGLMVAAGSEAELLSIVPRAIEELMEAHGMSVRVTELAARSVTGLDQFVAVPVSPQPELACM